MKCQILVSGKYKKNITDLSSAESALSMIGEPTSSETIEEDTVFTLNTGTP